MFGAMSGLGMLRFLSDLRGGVGARPRRGDRRAGDEARPPAPKVRTYSTGMKQKLALAQAFADPVEILILDEPTSALDPSARADVLGLVAEARATRPDGDLLGARPLRGRAGGRPGRDHATGPADARRGHARAAQSSG